mmetsp:Transcript_22622/g.52829  ORF Transcript_22622/g.52829 Transcript_22622/m.52829 type:complete len:88 (+) Transcript_22622:2120-2383(+)
MSPPLRGPRQMTLTLVLGMALCDTGFGLSCRGFPHIASVAADDALSGTWHGFVLQDDDSSRHELLRGVSKRRLTAFVRRPGCVAPGR